MGTREAFHAKLQSLMPTGHTNNVYFQPPPDLQLSYPCIVYNVDRILAKRADNSTYKIDTGYQVKYITKNPLDTVPKSILLNFPMSEFVRQFVSNGMYNNAFTIYY